MRSTWRMSVAGGALLAVLAVESASTQQRATEKTAADWPMYRHDLAGTGYSSLTQINVKNVAGLIQVWTYPLQGDAPAPTAQRGRGGPGGVNSEATPIVVNGVMYLPAANRVVALDPETGKEIWRHPVTGGAPSRRGVAYWPGPSTSLRAGDAGASPRILFTAGRRLIALDAKT